MPLTAKQARQKILLSITDEEIRKVARVLKRRKVAKILKTRKKAKARSH